MSGEGLSAEEHLDVLKDEIFYATDRLSSAEAKAVTHAVYNGDWLAAHDAEVADLARREEREGWDEWMRLTVTHLAVLGRIDSGCGRVVVEALTRDSGGA